MRTCRLLPTRRPQAVRHLWSKENPHRSSSPVIFAVRGLDWEYYYGDLWAFLFVAYGTDATIAAGSTIISQTAAPEDQSVASALFQTSCRLGYALGLAISTLIRVSVEDHALPAGRDPTEQERLDASVKGLRAAQWSCAGYLTLGAAVVAFGMKGWARLDEREHGGGKEDDVKPGGREKKDMVVHI
ncbi:hypothetical protein IAT38_007978 [Cryptococcus sp. DSM 104549]